VERVPGKLGLAVGEHRNGEDVAALELRVLGDIDDLDRDRAPADHLGQLRFNLLAQTAARPAVQRQRSGHCTVRPPGLVSTSVSQAAAARLPAAGSSDARRNVRTSAPLLSPREAGSAIATAASAPDSVPRSECVSAAPI